MDHIEWFSDTGQRLMTSDGKEVSIIEFIPVDDTLILEAWAKHLKEHYRNDSTLDNEVIGTGLSKEEYLRDFIFPDRGSIISGDFAEILIADYIEYVLRYLVPRTRYLYKDRKNDSPGGSDIIGFKILNKGVESPSDELIICEVKAALVKKNKQLLINAIKHSNKDRLRKGESLAAMKSRLITSGLQNESSIVERFQNERDKPYTEKSLAVGVISEILWEDIIVSNANTTDHFNKDNLILYIFKGKDMFRLAKTLYEIACKC